VRVSFLCYIAFLLYSVVVVTATFVTRGWSLITGADVEGDVGVSGDLRFVRRLAVPPSQSWSVAVYAGTVLLLIHFFLMLAYGQ